MGECVGSVGVVEFRRLGGRREIIEDKVEQREPTTTRLVCRHMNRREKGALQCIIFTLLHHVCLQRNPPRYVVHLLDLVSERLQGAQELIEPHTLTTRHMGDGQRGSGRTERARDDYAGDVVDRHHVDRVKDIGHLAELGTALDHADEEVVGVGYYLACISDASE